MTIKIYFLFLFLVKVLRELASQETGAAAARRRRSGGGATPSDDAASVASSSLGRAASRSRSHDGRRGRYNSCSSDDEGKCEHALL